jgi:LysR family transcriptional regulator, cell division regulator
MAPAEAADLRTFETVARLASMSRAAAELHTVQSNVTARIRALEEALGAPLFERHSRGVSLTTAGERLLPYAVRIRHLLQDARRGRGRRRHPARLADARHAGDDGRHAPVAAARDVPREAPAGGPRPAHGTPCELVDGVLEHRLEGALVCGPVEHPDLEAEVIFREELVILAARSARPLDDVLRASELKMIVLRAGCS